MHVYTYEVCIQVQRVSQDGDYEFYLRFTVSDIISLRLTCRFIPHARGLLLP